MKLEEIKDTIDTYKSLINKEDKEDLKYINREITILRKQIKNIVREEKQLA